MDKMIEMARAAMQNAHAPYSGFKVGACIKTKDGKYYTGCNVESVSYTPTLCAERCAAAKAVSEGSVDFESIAIVNSGGGLSWPCGVCRQFLAEFNINMNIIVADGTGKSRQTSLNLLLPNAFLSLEGKD